MKITLRLPFEVHTALVALAKRNDRSLNSEIVHLARAYIETRENKGKR